MKSGTYRYEFVYTVNCGKTMLEDIDCSSVVYDTTYEGAKERLLNLYKGYDVTIRQSEQKYEL